MMGHFPFYLIVFLKVMTLSLGSTILLPLFYGFLRIKRLVNHAFLGFWLKVEKAFEVNDWLLLIEPL